MREMKDSGVEWVGMIPCDWKAPRMKSCVLQRDCGAWGDEKQNDENDLICLRIADFNYSSFGFKDDDELTVRNYTPDIKKRLLLKKNDILIEKSGGGDKTPVGRAVIFDKDYDALYANFMDRIRVIDEIEPRYFLYILATFYSNQYVWNYIKQTTGIQNLDLKSMFANEGMPQPTKEEQNRIIDYLDSKCAKIDSIIEKQQAIIEKLIEYKLSVITEAVSIGIDGKKELRETGIPWIEAMPTEWKIARIKYNFYLKGRIGWQGLKANEFIDEGPFLVTGTDFIKGRVNWNTCYHISQERYDEAPEIHVKLGDLLITKDGTVGKVAYIDEKPEQVSLNSHLLIMRPTNNEYSNRFLFWVIQSGIFKKFFGLTQNGTIMASLSQEKITDFIYIMPRFEEQERISKYLEKEIARVDSNIEKKLLVIDKLNDYKKSLIYEVVTGKKEV